MISGQAAMTTSIPTTTKASSGRAVVALSLLIGIVAFFFFDLDRFLSLEALQANRDRLLGFADGHYASAVGLFIFAY
jgi:hypothetical protein